MAKAKTSSSKSTGRVRSTGGAARNPYQKYFKEWGGDNIWKKYKGQVKESNPYAKIADEAVERVVKTIGKYESYVKKREREHKKEIKAKDAKIEKLLARIAELEKANADKDKTIKTLQEVDKRAIKDHKKTKAKAAAAFRGDKMSEKAGEKASASKDTYERLINILINKGKIQMSPKRADALARSSNFQRRFQEYVDMGRLSPERLEELWQLNFSDYKREGFTQFGLASDTDENWDYDPTKTYNPGTAPKRAKKASSGKSAPKRRKKK